MGLQWFYPFLFGGQEGGVFNAGIETFRDDPLS
jgi:hypothetical protein